MELIQNNPYRIAGIFAGVTESELQRQKSKISKYASIGKEISSELDFSFLEKLDRNEKVIKDAFSSIEQNQDKVRNALFWFMIASPFDDTAIEYLRKGDNDKAVEIWEKVTKDKDITSKNYSCLNNLGTLKLLSKTKEDIKEGLKAKIKLIESPSFADFVNTIADQTYTIDIQKQVEKFVDDILKQFNGKYSRAETLELFTNCNGTTQKYLTQKVAEEPLNKIETQIESTKNTRKINKRSAYELGLKLFINCKDDLATLKLLLGKSELKYTLIADNLAKEVMQCGIDYFKEYQETKDPSEEGLNLLKYAKSIAVSNQVIERIDSNIEGMEEFKDKGINQAIAILSSIKLAYEKACSEIDKQVEELQYTTMPGIGGHSMRMQRYDISIDWSKVEKMKKQALNWDKVVEFVANGISLNDVATIQRCSDQSKVSEYKRLVDFLFNKLGPIQINKIKYVCFWKDVRAVQAISTAKKVGSSISSATEKGCYIATMAFGNYDHPQVIKLREFRDEFLGKYYLGRKFITFYYRYSPSLVERLKSHKLINNLIRKLLNLFIKLIKK